MSFGGDVYILYDQVRNEELHWGTRLKRTNRRNVYLHYKKVFINVHMGLRSFHLEARFMDYNDHVRSHRFTLFSP